MGKCRTSDLNSGLSMKNTNPDYIRRTSRNGVVNDMDTPTQPHTYTDCVSIEEDANHGSNNFWHRFGKIIFCFTWALLRKSSELNQNRTIRSETFSY